VNRLLQALLVVAQGEHRLSTRGTLNCARSLDDYVGVKELARDYERTEADAEVEEALRCELHLQAA
jgi:hypothetical protein